MLPLAITKLVRERGNERGRARRPRHEVRADEGEGQRASVLLVSSSRRWCSALRVRVARVALGG